MQVLLILEQLDLNRLCNGKKVYLNVMAKEIKMSNLNNVPNL